MGWTNADNRFGVTSFVVGTVLGDGVNYTSIQQAINDAGAGPVDIYIRPGTYTENLSFNGNVYLIAASMSGTTSPPAANSAHVNIIGDHNINQNGLTVCQGIFFTSTVTGFSLEDTATAGVAKLECINCFFDAGGQGFLLGGLTGNGQLRLVNCYAQSNGRTIVIPNGSLGGFYQLVDSILFSAGDANVYMDSSSSEGDVNNCILSASGSSNFVFDTNTVGATLDLSFSSMTSPGVACITFQAAASVFSFHNTYDPTGNSEYIIGPGLYSYCDDAIVGGKLSSGIDNAATQTIAGWRPWAESAISGITVTRGTAAFDSASFNVVDGFVQLSFAWVDQVASTTVPANQGNFFTAPGITLTLPAAPLQGDTCKFKCVTGAIGVIQANAGQALVTGSVATGAGGTTTSSSLGDAMELTFYAAGNFWIANSIIGVWTTI